MISDSMTLFYGFLTADSHLAKITRIAKLQLIGDP